MLSDHFQIPQAHEPGNACHMFAMPWKALVPLIFNPELATVERLVMELQQHVSSFVPSSGIRKEHEITSTNHRL